MAEPIEKYTLRSEIDPSERASYQLNPIASIANQIHIAIHEQEQQQQKDNSNNFPEHHDEPQVLHSYPLPIRKLLQYSWIAPLVISILLPILCIGVYLSALYQRQIEPILPYVSDAGNSAPQAEFFSQGMDILAVLECLTAIARYLQLRYYIKISYTATHLTVHQHNHLHRVNRVSLCIALLSAFLMSMVGNFRTSEANDAHCTAASSMLITMLVYGGYHTYICHQLFQRGKIESAPLTLGVSILIGTTAFIVCIFASFTSFGLFGMEKFYNNSARLNWNRNQPGYGWHVTCTALEWVTINIFALVFLCFCKRMRQFSHWSEVLSVNYK